MANNMRASSLVIVTMLLLVACEDPEARKAREAAAARTRISAESTKAIGASNRPAAPGAWSDALLTKRLVDAGLAPQRRDSVRAHAWMGVPVHAYALGVATVDAYIYRDSVVRVAAVAKLDPLTFAPRGQPSPWAAPHEVIQNGNLVAVVVGGTDRQRDRIVTALAAGIGAP